MSATVSTKTTFNNGPSGITCDIDFVPMTVVALCTYAERLRPRASVAGNRFLEVSVLLCFIIMVTEM